MKGLNRRSCRFLSRLFSRAYHFRGSPIYVWICWRMAQQYDTYSSIEQSLGHTGQHKGDSPFTSRQYLSLVGRFFSLGVPACNSPLDETTYDYSSSLGILEVLPANYFFRMPIVGQNRLLLFWSPAAILVCRRSVDKSVGVACCMSLDC